MLAVDGLVAITVPNLNALATRTLRDACSWVHGGYNTPGHINLFHAAALERLLARAGLTLLEAHGLFSGDPVELLAFLSGATRGAFDALDPTATLGGLPDSTVATIEAVWPGAALVEQLDLASPILRVLACRQGREEVFAPEIAARRARRAQEITAAAAAMIACEPDYKGLTRDLQQEINRRDELLVATTARLQHEVDRRDEEITHRDKLMQQTEATLQQTEATLKQEIARRDALLNAASERFDRTFDQRARAGFRAVKRAAWWLGRQRPGRQ
jgi:hypothetical protein